MDLKMTDFLRGLLLWLCAPVVHCRHGLSFASFPSFSLSVMFPPPSGPFRKTVELLYPYPDVEVGYKQISIPQWEGCL